MDPRARRVRGGSLLLSPVGGALPRLHLVATREVVGRTGFEARAAALLDAGGARLALHLRARDLPGRELYRLAGRLQGAAARSGSLLLVNDRVDVALAVGAAGVQLGAGALPVAAVRAFGPELLIGASIHAESEATRATAGGADFLLAGTLWPTETHPGRPGSGTAWLGALPAEGPPVVGIGGVDPVRAARLRSLGLHGAAVVRGVWEAAEPHRALDEYLRALYG